MKRLFIELEIQDGEREHTHRIVTMVEEDDIFKAADEYASTYWGEAEWDDVSERWMAHGYEIAIQVSQVKELTQEEYDIMNKVIYGY